MSGENKIRDILKMIVWLADSLDGPIADDIVKLARVALERFPESIVEHVHDVKNFVYVPVKLSPEAITYISSFRPIRAAVEDKP